MALGLPARPLHALIAAPSLLFLVTLGVMLFRPVTGVQILAIDRILFFLLVFVVWLRTCLLRQLPRITPSVTWPMVGLMGMAVPAVLAAVRDAQAWSVFAAKWVVPLALFHISGLVFDDPASRRRLESFLLLALAYLVFIAIAFLAGATALIFPRYILDESLGIHLDRARGPFLEAVANGVAINLLGLIALDGVRRKRLRGVWAILLLTGLPVAVLATMTRSVWLSFAGAVMALFGLTSSRRVRLTSLGLIAAGSLGVLVLLISGNGAALEDRAGKAETVEYRVSIYEAGWQMFLEKPILGWGANRAPFELAKRIGDFRQDAFYFHNTYLEIVVHHGVVGLGLYVWMIAGLFRVGRRGKPSQAGEFLDGEFRALWPALLCVYLVSASFVVMNYQFVNGLLFTLAGILAAQNQCAQGCDGRTR